MIEALKSEEVVEKAGGRFKLCALIQKRLQEIVDGARPMVEREGRSDLEVVIDEILHDKLVVDYDRSEMPSEAPPHVRQLLDDANALEAAAPSGSSSSQSAALL
ncbi:MAG: DNA-directed RNA polymerase subunit omega [Planctomycetota bacterium]